MTNGSQDPGRKKRSLLSQSFISAEENTIWCSELKHRLFVLFLMLWVSGPVWPQNRLTQWQPYAVVQSEVRGLLNAGFFLMAQFPYLLVVRLLCVTTEFFPQVPCSTASWLKAVHLLVSASTAGYRTNPILKCFYSLYMSHQYSKGQKSHTIKSRIKMGRQMKFCVLEDKLQNMKIFKSSLALSAIHELFTIQLKVVQGFLVKE